MPKEKAPTLSRIYQGRVSGLKLLEPKAIDGDAVSKDRRDAILMGHHSEFQRAVNYHQFQLLRLSTDESSPLGKIRKRMLEADVAIRRLMAQIQGRRQRPGIAGCAAEFFLFARFSDTRIRSCGAGSRWIEVFPHPQR